MQVTIIAHDQTTAIIHPTEATLDFPALTVACSGTQRTTALRLLAFAPFKGGDRRLDTTTTQLAPKVRTIIGFVSHQFLWTGLGTPAFARNRDGLQRRFRQREFMGLGTGHMQANRQTAALDDRHDLRAFANLGLAYAIAPFLAGTKLPSKKACVHSSFRSASSWPRKVRQIRSHVPSSDHSFSRRQQVLSEPYSRGKSSHAHPVFSTYRMPFNVWRSSLRGRPRLLVFFGMSGSITAHCSSVRSCLLMPRFYRQSAFLK